jgi:hypothetical protein
MIKGCQDRTDRGIYPFDDLIMEMFNHQSDRNQLHAIEAYIIKNKYDYCLVHLHTLLSCCRGYLFQLEQKKK